MSEFKREERYIVIKLKDLEFISAVDQVTLFRAVQRANQNLPKRECLVIESDWPEYEPAWAMIEARMTGRTAPAEDTKSDQYRAELYDEVWHLARDMGYGNVTDALADVERLKANAERYLWLRGKRRNNIVVRNGVSHLFDELLDRSIDAARTAKPEVKL